MTEDEPSDADIIYAIRKYPHTTFVTSSRACRTRINTVVTNFIFRDINDFLTVKSSEYGSFKCYRGMKVILTRNCNKSIGFVNGQQGIVKYFRYSTIIIELPNKSCIAIYPSLDVSKELSYPMQPFYASTIFKVQGDTLEHITVWFDSKIMANGAAYVALSRVIVIMKRTHEDPRCYWAKRKCDFILNLSDVRTLLYTYLPRQNKAIFNGISLYWFGLIQEKKENVLCRKKELIGM